MRVTKCLFVGLSASLLMCATAVATHAADDGLITKPSKYSAKETVARFEAAVKQREAAGFIVFTEIDHADAAKKFGLNMRPRTVIRATYCTEGQAFRAAGMRPAYSYESPAR